MHSTCRSAGLFEHRYVYHASLQWRHNERDGAWDHRRLDYLLNRMFKRRSKKYQSAAWLAFVGGGGGDSLVNGELSAQKSVTRVMFPLDNVIISLETTIINLTKEGRKTEFLAAQIAYRGIPLTKIISNLLYSGLRPCFSHNDNRQKQAQNIRYWGNSCWFQSTMRNRSSLLSAAALDILWVKVTDWNRETVFRYQASTCRGYPAKRVISAMRKHGG